MPAAERPSSDTEITVPVLPLKQTESAMNHSIADHVTPLTKLERDALGELSNIAMAQAAYSLRQMVDSEIVLSVPRVEVLSREAATVEVKKGGSSRLVAVPQDFTGAFAGRAMLIFPEPSS